MSDLFADIMDNIPSKEAPKEKKSNSDPSPSTSKKSSSAITVTKKSSSLDGSSKKSSSAENSISKKSSESKSIGQTNSSNSNSEQSFDKLADIMATGFAEMRNAFQGFNNAGQELEYETEDEEFNTESNDVDSDIFDSISNEINSGENVGPELRPSLAGLTDKLLNFKLDDSVLKEKREKYLRPKNVEYLNTPKINKPVWENISGSNRFKEASFQGVQKDFLNSAVPVLRVMEKIFDARDNLGSLEAKDLLDTLKDSLIFLGSANSGMIKIRRENVKHDLPKTMQGLCRDSIEFSSSYLFGDNLNNTIKEVSELNKISNNLKPRGSFSGRGFNSGFPRRGRGQGFNRGSRGSHRGGRGRFFKRFNPYNKSTDNKPLNQSGPSNK